MKKIITILSFLSIMSATVFSQSLGLSYLGGSFNNGDTITLFSIPSDAEFSIQFYISNNSSNTISLKGKKTELSIIPGSTNWFCDWMSCYPPSVFTTPTALTLNAGDTNKVFTADYNSHDNAGASFVMYTFWNTQNINDTIAVVVKYMTGSNVGVNASSKNTVSNTYPNPATDYFNIDYTFEGSRNAEIQIMNVLGSIVKTEKLSTSANHARIDVSNLKPGSYFYSVIVDKQRVSSKKLIIK